MRPGGLGAFIGVAVLGAGLSVPLAAVADSPPRPPHAHRKPHFDPPGVLPDAALHPDAAAGLAQKYSGTPIDVTTFHYDTLRTGWNQSETDLTVATVASTKFGLLKTLKVDGNVFAQPLLVSNFVMPDGKTRNVLIVATGNDSVFAYDAQTYATLWQVSLGTPQSSGDVGCSDVIPEYGISGTPVIVRSAANAATIYLVAATEPQPSSFQTELHALDLGTGADAQPPVPIAPSANLSNGSKLRFDPQNQWNRAGLAYANGSIYVGIGSHCDNNSGGIAGWLLRYSPALKLRSAFHTIENPASTELASIWMTGFAPAVDAGGNLYVVTGNGDFNLNGSHRDYGETALSLTPELNEVNSTFTPAHYATLNQYDVDFGSGGIMLLPPIAGQTAPPLAVAMGKDAVLYLLNQGKLGGLAKDDAGALQATRLGSSGNGIWGGPAFFGGAGGPLVYVQISSGDLLGFSVAAGATPALTQTVSGTSPAGYGGSMPVVSSNAAAAGTGVVWLIRRASTGTARSLRRGEPRRADLCRRRGHLDQSRGQPVPDRDGGERPRVCAGLQNRKSVRADALRRMPCRVECASHSATRRSANFWRLLDNVRARRWNAKGIPPYGPCSLIRILLRVALAQRISPVSGLDGSAPMRRGMRLARCASRPASTASFIARAIRTGSPACAIAEFSSTAVQPSSIAIAASEAVPTPASTSSGTFVCSMSRESIAAFWMPRPEPIGAPSGMMATQPRSSSRLAATGSSAQ